MIKARLNYGGTKHLDNVDAKVIFFNVQLRLGYCRYIWLYYLIIALALLARTSLLVVEHLQA
jgi:hypothetical protein